MKAEQGRSTPRSEVPIEEGRVRERNFDILPTHIKDFYLLVDHDTEPDLTRSQTRTLRETGTAYGIKSEVIKQHFKLQEEPHKELVDMGINNPGLRGGRDLIVGVEIQITPKTENVFDESRLDESLGERRPEFAHKKVSVTIELNPDRDEVAGFITSVKRRLKRQGFSREEIEKRLKVQRTLRVDEKALRKLIDTGEVTLMPGTWNLRTKTWEVASRKIPTREKLAEAEKNVGNSQLNFDNLTS